MESLNSVQVNRYTVIMKSRVQHTCNYIIIIAYLVHSVDTHAEEHCHSGTSYFLECLFHNSVNIIIILLVIPVFDDVYRDNVPCERIGVFRAVR